MEEERKGILEEVLPIELIAIILSEGLKGDFLSQTVASFVCTSWYNLIKEGKKREEENDEAGREYPAKYINDELTKEAAKKGYLALLKWLREQGCPLNSFISIYATQSGDLELMKWIKDQGCTFSEETFIAATANCSIEVLKWLRDEARCPWDHRTFPAACKRGDMQVLSWLKMKGCSWNALSCANSGLLLAQNLVVKKLSFSAGAE